MDKPKRSLMRPLLMFTAEFSKDVSTIIRDGRSMLLLCIVPLLILLTLSFVFGRPLNERPPLAYIGVCDLDRSVESIEFANLFRNVSRVTDFSFGCPDSLLEQVRTGKQTAGIIINEGFGASLKSGRQAAINVYVDNSRIQVASAAESIIRAVVAEAGEAISVRFISSVFQDLAQASAQLDEIIAKIDDAKEQAAGIDAELFQSETKLRSVDVGSLFTSLTAANTSIQYASDELNNASSELTVIQAKFDEYDQILNSTKTDVRSARDGLIDARNTIIATEAGLNCQNNRDIPPCDSLLALRLRVENERDKLHLRYTQIETAQADLAKTNQTITEFLAKINSSRDGVENASSRIESLFVLATTLEESKDETLATITSSRTTISQVLVEASAMRELALESKSSIGLITNRDPKASVVPLTTERSLMFENRTYFYVLLPGLVQVIVLFISLFITSTRIVREKQNGTLMRLFVSHINRIEYVVMKIISFSIIMLVPFALLSITAAFIEPTLVLADSLPYVLAIGFFSVITYSSLGIIIGWLSDSESSAFLTSLVMGLPFLFMSGLLFPYEFMPPFIGFLGSLLPLSVAVKASELAMLYRLVDLFSITGVSLYSVLVGGCTILCVRFFKGRLS